MLKITECGQGRVRFSLSVVVDLMRIERIWETILQTIMWESFKMLAGMMVALAVIQWVKWS